MLAGPSLAPGLYLHVPFCSAVCPYCDFAVVKDSLARRQRFVDTLLVEISLAAGERQPFDMLPFDTVYFGGGTPSLLPEADLERILRAARQELGALPEAAVFFEANPEDVSPESLQAWRRQGVRFLSLGVQSFDAEELRFLGRRHSPDEARRAIELALAAGFDTVSVDLIYGLPGQSRERWLDNLAAALALAPQHLSCYQLTVKDGTPFGLRARRGELVELAESSQAELFVLTHETLAAAGLAAYEVSNFAAAPEHRSRHNQKYWRHVPYLGLGPSAHSFDGRRRWWNERNLTRYSARVESGERPIAGSETLSAGQRALEALMLALRTTEGLDLATFRDHHGADLVAANGQLLEDLSRRGLLALNGDRLVLSVRGLAVADAIAAELELGLPGEDGV